MGNVFSTCINKNQIGLEKQRQLYNSEYRTLQVEDKIYILFNNKENVNYFEI